MQAIIMAAGKGSRLGPLTNGMPKSFAEVRGKKLIEYNIELLHKYGIRDITIVTGYRQDAFEELLKNVEGIRFRFNPFYEMTNVLGSFYIGMENLNDDFIYMHADTLCDTSIFERLLKSDADVSLPVELSSCDEEAMKVKLVENKLVRISKQIPLEESTGEFIGIAKFNKCTIDELKNKTKDLMVEKDFTGYFEDAIQRLIDETEFDVRMMSTEEGFWKEIDFLEDYKDACNRIPESLVRL